MTMEAAIISESVLEELPFTSRGDNGELFLWSVETTGDADSDVALGTSCALMVLEAARMADSALIIAQVLRDMVLVGKVGAAEIGFITTIAMKAKVGQLN